ncbi:MAG: YggS family pyridoxal phosphate-dependent enzyme [Desulfosarcina sp.]
MKERLARIRQRIAETATACGRDPSTIRLVAVSKTVDAVRVDQAILAGADILGENYIQEARDKIGVLGHRAVEWHFIGHLQSNKAKTAVRLFDLIHSLDSFKLAQALDKAARKIGKVQSVLIQVNISGEETKSGIEEAAAIDLVKQIGQLEGLRIKGLMTMPPFFDAPELARPFFRRLARLRERMIACHLSGVAMDELSMGMTGDFTVAIEEGATLVRIGTAIFGARS